MKNILIHKNNKDKAYNILSKKKKINWNIYNNNNLKKNLIF